MSWSRVVWMEKEEEGVVPSNWLENERTILRWPRMYALRAMNEGLIPQVNWRTFDVIKIKLTCGNTILLFIFYLMHHQLSNC